MTLDEFREANRLNWSDRVSIHWASELYDVAGFVGDPNRLSSVVEFDRRYLPDVADKTLLHLQCHFGKDTLSWARLGARVTGTDFSEEAISAARRLSDESGTPGRFVISELYETPTTLTGERFDIVYTGVGALCWLPDIVGWGRVVDEMLKPGGVLLIREGHPVLWALDDEDTENLTIRFDYFESDPQPFVESNTYAGDGELAHPQTYSWNHSLAEIMGALTTRGLVVDLFEEHRTLEWQGHPLMVDIGDGMFEFPAPLRDRVPVMYVLRARKPD